MTSILCWSSRSWSRYLWAVAVGFSFGWVGFDACGAEQQPLLQPPISPAPSSSNSSQGSSSPGASGNTQTPTPPPPPAGIPSAAEPAEDLYALAVGLYSRGDWALAARELQTFLRQYPQHPNARRATFLLGESLLQLGQDQDALARFTEYLQQEPQGPWSAKALFRSGEAAFFADKKEQAVTLLKEFLGRYPADPLGAYALSYLGQLARKNKDWKTAADHYRQCLERFPQSGLQTECQLGLAQCLEAQGQAEQAIPLYQAVAQRDNGPPGGDAQFRLGVLLYNLQRYADAAAALELFERRFASSAQ
ncbi:MAG TPA: tetratricopeptide repeat protein, partial [Thermoguttaceae bacterium]|nr:tetratricopeptide repeat protein [Thermoguttaceae bacterium]